MEILNETDETRSRGRSPFATTRWTMVMRARGEAPEARAALGELCEAYWTPVFRFLMREGRDEDHSRELTQEFVARLLSGSGVEGVDPSRGKFRSYLLGALKHFLAERKRNESRQKRGGDAGFDSIDSFGSDTSSGVQVSDPAATVPDTYFDRQWALAVMDRGLLAVQSECEVAGKAKQFGILKPWLIGDTGNFSQTQAAAELGMTAGAIKVAIHRLRKSFGEAVRTEIAQTVDGTEEVAEELRYLIDVLT